MEQEAPISTLLIPPHLLQTAYLVGKVPFRACKLDPRTSYGLYVPEKQYVAFQHAHQSGSDTSKLRLPLIVNVHGTKHDASPHRDNLVPFADKHGVAVLAPFFPAALDHAVDLDSYKILRSKTLKSDKVLLSMIDEIAHIWPGIRTEKFALMGFSGGGQFAHRFLYLHPDRLSAVVVGAPGSTTLLDERLWPTGVGDVDVVFDRKALDLEEINRVERILLVVGEQDNNMSSLLELKEWFKSQRRSSRGLAMGGTAAREDFEVTRIEKLRNLYAHWQERGIQSELSIVPHATHNHLQVLPTILQWLEEDLDVIRGVDSTEA